MACCRELKIGIMKFFCFVKTFKLVFDAQVPWPWKCYISGQGKLLCKCCGRQMLTFDEKETISCNVCYKKAIENVLKYGYQFLADLKKCGHFGASNVTQKFVA